MSAKVSKTKLISYNAKALKLIYLQMLAMFA